jgi:hypothetical protein
MAALLPTPLDWAQLNSGQPQILSTNQTITPLAPRGASYEPLNPRVTDASEYTAGQAVSTVVSPDKKTLLILTSGFNRAECGQREPGGFDGMGLCLRYLWRDAGSEAGDSGPEQL